MIVLVVGFALAVFTKADASLFTGFVAGLGGVLGSFMWGNAKVHSLQFLDPPPQPPPPNPK